MPDAAWTAGLYVAATVLVAAGLAIVFTLLWIGRAGRRRRVLEELLALREPLQRDPLGALPQVAGPLARLGVVCVAWQGQWYGAPVEGHAGPPPPEPQRPADWARHDFRQADLQLQLRVGLHGLRGEKRLFAEQAAQLLFAILHGALAARELALVSAMAQRARMAVFLQHDLRNLAQWVELMADQLAEAPDDAALLQAARRLQPAAMQAQQRARRIAGALLRPDAGGEGDARRAGGPPMADAGGDSRISGSTDQGRAQPTPLSLAPLLREAAAQHQVRLDLVGDFGTEDAPRAVPWDAAAWTTVVENLLGNVSRLSREALQPARCTVRLRESADGLALAFETPQLPLRVPMARLFEPWVGASPGGAGLGLYQARRAAVAAGGDLRAEPCGAGIAVILCLPCKKT